MNLIRNAQSKGHKTCIEQLESRILCSVAIVTPALQDTSTSATVGVAGLQFVDFRDADGTSSQITYKGGGSAVVIWSGTNLSSVAMRKGILIDGSSLVLSSVNGDGGSNSVLSITASRGKRYISVDAIHISANILAVNAPGAYMQGALSFTRGSAKRISIWGAKDASIGDGGQSGSTWVNLVFKSLAPMVNTTLACDSAKSVTVPSWTADAPIGAAFGADPSTLIAFDLDRLNVAGNLTNFELQVEDTLIKPTARVTVGGAIDSDYFLLATGLRSLSAARMTGTSIVCDMSLPSGQFPQSADQFYAPPSLIDSLTLDGRGSADFVNSYVVAKNIGTMQLGRVQMDNSGQAFGVAAQSIALIHGARSNANKSFVARKLSSPAAWAAAKAKLRLNWQDFTIDML